MTFKSVFFSILFITAFLAVGFMLYQKQNGKDSDSTALAMSATTTNPAQVKAATITADDTVDVSYDSADRTKHLALNNENIIWYTNYERVQNGLDPLVVNYQLNTSAANKATDMFDHQYFDHTRPGSTNGGFDSFIDAQHYDFIKIGENLAMGDFSTSAEVVTAWMNSPEHRRNILDPLYKEIGVSMRQGSMNGDQTTLFVQHFGDPRTSCPTVSASAKTAITTLKTQIASLQKQLNAKQGEVDTKQTATDDTTSLVGDYNSLVMTYNASVASMTKLVTAYNKQIKAFDDCISAR